jgi:hypothetical protein
VTQLEVGVEGRQVVLLVTVPDPGGVTADQTRVPLSADEARDLCNGLGEAIRCVASGGVMA